jgi:hypothetical protein
MNTRDTSYGAHDLDDHRYVSVFTTQNDPQKYNEVNIVTKEAKTTHQMYIFRLLHMTQKSKRKISIAFIIDV